jgi:carbon storage regulator
MSFFAGERHFWLIFPLHLCVCFVMLVITRKTGEAVILNGDVEIVIVSVEGNQIRLGFNAPSTVSIHRKEVYERIQRANLEAAVSQKSIRLPHLPGGGGTSSSES